MLNAVQARVRPIVSPRQCQNRRVTSKGCCEQADCNQAVPHSSHSSAGKCPCLAQHDNASFSVNVSLHQVLHRHTLLVTHPPQMAERGGPWNSGAWFALSEYPGIKAVGLRHITRCKEGNVGDDDFADWLEGCAPVAYDSPEIE